MPVSKLCIGKLAQETTVDQKMQGERVLLGQHKYYGYPWAPLDFTINFL